MKAIVSVIGKDHVGIMAMVSNLCAEHNASIVDINQTIVDDYFAMIMIVNISELNVSFGEFVDIMSNKGKESNLDIHVMHEEIFNMMHSI